MITPMLRDSYLYSEANQDRGRIQFFSSAIDLLNASIAAE